MANPEHVRIVRAGTETLKDWRAHHPRSKLDLSKADLSYLRLREANLRSADLTETDLHKADMVCTDFTGSDLSGAILGGAFLEEATLQATLLIGANLSDADLFHATITESDLDNAKLFGTVLMGSKLNGSYLEGALFSGILLNAVDLSETLCGFTVFADCDFRGAFGLDTVRHEYASTIGIDTILRSEGHIPPEFLRACGLPDRIVDFVQSIAQEPIKYYSCFLSHSSKDIAFVNHFRGKLKKAGVQRWYFPEDAKIGMSLPSEIKRAIRGNDKLVILCSRNSLESPAVIQEIEEGLAYEQEEAVRRLADSDKMKNHELSKSDFLSRRYHTQVLFPVTIDDYIFDGWQHPLKYELQKNRVIGDFRSWENLKAFDKAFKKLLKDLNSDD